MKSKGVPRVKVEQIGDVLVITLPSRLDAAGLALIESDFSAAATTHKGKLLADIFRNGEYPYEIAHEHHDERK